MGRLCHLPPEYSGSKCPWFNQYSTTSKFRFIFVIPSELTSADHGNLNDNANRKWLSDS
jgi:hypothetical protein